MAIVYDVVQTVAPGTMTSTEPGRYGIEHHSDLDRARVRADVMQGFATVPGISYTVEDHDEECPGRAPLYRDRKDPWFGRCTCKPTMPNVGDAFLSDAGNVYRVRAIVGSKAMTERTEIIDPRNGTLRPNRGWDRGHMHAFVAGNFLSMDRWPH